VVNAKLLHFNLIMRLNLLATLAFCLSFLTTVAQNTYTIKGFVGDSVLKVKLHNAPVSVLNVKDSILRKFTRSAVDGSFTIYGLPAGKYVLMVTYPECADYVDPFTLEGTNTTRDMGNINMQLKSRLLSEVLIKSTTLGMKVQGDTTTYNASAYKIQPNDKVEDLLRQFPGIQIDKDGKVTAQGKPAQFLVDGEVFFGDDPLLVTRNIRADMVDKVQVYDKKSDQATFTGIDDGKRTKTINVVLKEDKKNGMFGKADVGKGTDGYYEGQGLFNKFKGKYKASVYGTTSNDGKNNLGYADNNRLGTASVQTVVLDDGEIATYRGGYSEDALDNSSYNGTGYPSARTGGAHYDTKFNEDKSTLNANYKIGSLSLTTLQNNISQVNLPGRSQTTEGDQNSYSHTFKQKGDITYQNNPNKNTNYRIGVDATFKNAENKNNSLSSTRDSTGRILNTTSIDDNKASEQKVLNASFIFNKKLAKDGRTISWNVSEAYSQTRTKGFLYSDIYTPVNTTHTLTDQYKPTTATSSTLNSNLSYTEPISKTVRLAFNYGLGVNNSLSNRESFNKSATGNYDAFDGNFSNSYKFNQLTNQLGLMFNYKHEDDAITFGSKASAVDFKQINQYTGGIYNRRFINWSPQATYQHSFNPATSFYFSYSGHNGQPTIDQLQPVRDNSNPLSIVIGNEKLTPSFRHSFYGSLNSSQLITATSLYIDANYSFVENVIVNNVVNDRATGKSTTQYVNLTNAKPTNYNVYINYNRKIWAGITTSTSLNTNGSTNYNYTNDTLNQAKNRSYSISFSLNKSVTKKYDFYINASPGYEFNTQTLLPSNNYNSATFSVYGGGTLFLPGKIQLSANLDYRYQAAVKTAPAVYYKMLTASISKTFFKADNLKLSIAGNNLLNQNQNQRNVNANGFTQNTYNSILRYFMLNITWDFSKFGTSASTTN